MIHDKITNNSNVFKDITFIHLYKSTDILRQGSKFHINVLVPPSKI